VLSGEPVSVRGGRFTWRNVFTGRTQDLDDVGVFVWSTPRVADDAVAKQLFEAGIDTRLIGDRMAPCNLLCAVHEGEAAALAL
jgi:dimethylglycine catabolism A